MEVPSHAAAHELACYNPRCRWYASCLECDTSTAGRLTSKQFIRELRNNNKRLQLFISVGFSKSVWL